MLNGGDNNESPVHLPVKKKKSVPSKKKKLAPPTGNLIIIDYFDKSVKSPDVLYDNTATTRFTTPPTVPKEVDATTVMTCYSVISSSAASIKSSS